MALTIIKEKVVYVAPPKQLDASMKKILEQTPVNKTLIKRAISRTYKVV